MKIIENFLPTEIHQKYVKLLMSNDFPYYFIDGVSHTDGTEDDFFFFIIITAIHTTLIM